MRLNKTLIVFDIDGTLTDSVSQHQSAFVAALTGMDVLQINTDFKIYKHHTDSHIAKVIYELDRKETFDAGRLQQFEESLAAALGLVALPEIAGARELIVSLQADPAYAICFATGSLHKPAAYKLAQLGIPFHDAQLVASNDIEDRESIVATAIERAKTYYRQESFDRIISIGDGLWDLLTAQNLGLEFIGIGATHKAALFERGMKRHFDDWRHVTPALFEVINAVEPLLEPGSPAFRFREARLADIPGMQRVRHAVTENRLSDPSLVRDEDYVIFLSEHGKGWIC